MKNIKIIMGAIAIGCIVSAVIFISANDTQAEPVMSENVVSDVEESNEQEVVEKAEVAEPTATPEPTPTPVVEEEVEEEVEEVEEEAEVVENETSIASVVENDEASDGVEDTVETTEETKSEATENAETAQTTQTTQTTGEISRERAEAEALAAFTANGATQVSVDPNSGVSYSGETLKEVEWH